MSRRIVNEKAPVEIKPEEGREPNIKPEVNYDNVTTTSSLFRDNKTPPINIKTIKNSDPELVIVTPKDDRKTYMAGKWYNLKRGEQIVVTPEIKSQLGSARLIVEEEDTSIHPEWVN